MRTVSHGLPSQSRVVRRARGQLLACHPQDGQRKPPHHPPAKRRVRQVAGHVLQHHRHQPVRRLTGPHDAADAIVLRKKIALNQHRVSEFRADLATPKTIVEPAHG